MSTLGDEEMIFDEEHGFTYSDPSQEQYNPNPRRLFKMTPGFIEPAPKENIRPYTSTGHASRTAHIFNGAGRQCMKVVYSPSNSKDDLKTVWRENEVEFEGIKYTFSEIGDLLWIQEPLTLKNGITLSKLNYAARSESNVNKYGYLYSRQQARTVVSGEPASKGWRIPTEADWQNLISAIGGTGQAVKIASKQSSTDSRYCGTNVYGLEMMQGGYNHNQGSGKTNNYDKAWYYLTDSNANGEIVFYSYQIGTIAVRNEVKSNYTLYCPLKLCKNKIPWGTV